MKAIGSRRVSFRLQRKAAKGSMLSPPSISQLSGRATPLFIHDQIPLTNYEINPRRRFRKLPVIC
jgi:hypothetical protein